MNTIENLICRFDGNPVMVRKEIVSMWDSNRERFLELAAPVLCQPGGGQAKKYLVSFLLQNENLLEKLGDLHRFCREEAIEIARLAATVDPSMDVRVATMVAAGNSGDARRTARYLEILEAISHPSSLLPLLKSVSGHKDPKVMSKAILMMGRGNRNPGWVKQQLLTQADRRVCANAVESIWGLDSAEAKSVFLSAVQDAHPRVAANGALGLYLAEESHSIELIMELAGNADPTFRASIAWIMGRTQDPRFLPVLATLVRDSHEAVRSNALRSIARIRSFRQGMEKLAPFIVRISKATITSSGMRTLWACIRHPGKVDGTALSPMCISLEESKTPALRYEAQHHPAADVALTGMLLPFPGDLDEAYQSAVNTACARALAAKTPNESWAALSYTNNELEAARADVRVSKSHEVIQGDLRNAYALPYSGYLTALDKMATALCTTTHQKAVRDIILTGSPMPESTSVVFYRQSHMAHILSTLKETGIKIHCLAPAECPPLMRVTLHELSRETGGTFQNAENATVLGQLLEDLLVSIHPNYFIRYWGITQNTLPRKVRLNVQSPLGLGERTAELSLEQ